MTELLAKPEAAPGLFDRTLRNLRSAWRDLVGGDGAAPLDPDLADERELERLRLRMAACLEARGGEVSARARAVELGRFYLGLGTAGRRRYLELLATRFDRDPAAIDTAARRLLAGDGERGGLEHALAASLEPPRAQLLRQLNAMPQGAKFLVDLRADLLALRRESPALAGLEADLKRLLAGWFDVGFLDLRRITWDSPAALLEKLARYEAVHAVRGWIDLKNRLDSDRRCFAFFLPAMPDEPIIFVEVALVRGLAANVRALLDEKAPLGDPHAADTAVFYSISNAQRGLDGIGFGGFLIKRVVDALSREFPRLRSFATLSPLPAFRRWFGTQDQDRFLVKADRRALGADGLAGALVQPDWHREPRRAAALKGPLLRAAAYYLLSARREDGKAFDPVAHFHLSNGARVERLNWLADSSARGLDTAFGIMVNYAYRLGAIEANHEAYAADRSVAHSGAVAALARNVRP